MASARTAPTSPSTSLWQIPPSSVACPHTLKKVGGSRAQRDLQEQEVPLRLLQEEHRVPPVRHGRTYGGIPQRTYSNLPHKRLEYVPVNWAAPNAETYWLQRLSLTLWKGNAYKVKYLADLYHIPCASSTSPVTCWTHTITLFFTVSSTSFFLLRVS